MAHNLKLNANGQSALVHTSDIVPWHGLGQAIPNGTLTSELAIQAAGLDYTVTKEQLFRANGDPVEGAFATIASDSNKVLGTVGADYTALQNRIAFGVTDKLVADEGWIYKTAGALGNGEKVWMLLEPKQGGTFEIVKGDPIESKLLFSNSHDGSSSVEARETTITVVCQNTLNMAFRERKASLKIRHTASVEQRSRLAIDLLKGYVEHLKDFKAAMTYLAKHTINDALVEAFEVEMFGNIDATPEGRGRTILSNKLEAFERLLVTGKGTEIKGRVGNLYGLVQAYTEWVDWESQVKGTSDRTNAIVFGNGSKLKTAALDYALVLAKGGK